MMSRSKTVFKWHTPCERGPTGKDGLLRDDVKCSIIQENNLNKKVYKRYHFLVILNLKLMNWNCYMIIVAPSSFPEFLFFARWQTDKHISSQVWASQFAKDFTAQHFECVLTTFSSYNHGFYLRNSSFFKKDFSVKKDGKIKWKTKSEHF